MRTIKFLATLIAVMAIGTLSVAQQKHEVNVTTGQKIVIENLLGKIIIKNHSGSNFVIEGNKMAELPEKAKGLKEIYGGGADNTGIGLNVKQSEKLIMVSGATKRSEDATYTFLVPGNVNLKIDYSSPFGYDDIEVNGFSGELEVSMLNEGIDLEKVTGPMTIHTINGNIDIDFKSLNQKSPSSITSINGEVNITIPSSTAVDLKLSTMHGEIYTDCDIEFESKSDNKESHLTMIGGHSKTNGKLNGGGVELTLSSINGSIYLRKK